MRKPWQTVTPEATMLWARRVYWDFSKKAPANAAVKQKDNGDKILSVTVVFNMLQYNWMIAHDQQRQYDIII